MALASPDLDVPEAFTADLEAVVTVDDVMQTFESVRNGKLDPLELGLLEPGKSLWDGIEAHIYKQKRVATWIPKIVEGEIVKIETMHRLTDTGKQFEVIVKDLVSRGLIDLSAKQASEWRVLMNRQWMRMWSLDELPQLLVNVLGIGSGKFPDLLKMNMVGAGRPPMAEEISIQGDNSNDNFCRALEKNAQKVGYSWRENYRRVGTMYVPGLVTPATARGNRQLNSTEDSEDWINGIERYDKMLKIKSRYKRNMLIGSWVLNTTKHVMAQTEAI